MDKRNIDILNDKNINKSTAFTKQEREALKLRGLLPYAICSQDTQKERIINSLHRKPSDIERYIFLSALQDRNENLFYRTVMDHIDVMLPLIYTPTVGQACKEFSEIFQRSRGFYISPEDKGEISQMLDNWPEKDIRVIVVTDGQRILGLGDLGANGMGIPIGKLALYTACAGVHPHQCLPVMLDVGTNNEELLHNPLYLGYPHKRIEGAAYDALVDEFITAATKKYPNVLIQFEDFLTPNAYRLLNKYKEKILCFNDDIQGTAAVALAGVYAATRITGIPFSQLRIMFLGAGSAATGIADLAAQAFQQEGLSAGEAYKRLWFVDVNGLVVDGRNDLLEHNLPYAHDHAHLSFVEAIDAIKPHVLIGATGVPHTFTQEVIEHMSAINERPVIFALSNPTSRAECTAEQAYTWSKGKAVFTSGSPFAEVNFNDQVFKPSQGNNVYIFPGVGLGAISCLAKTIPSELFLVAARTLAAQVSDEDIRHGAIYPPIHDIRDVSLRIAIAVADKAYDLGIARNPRPADLGKSIADYRYDPAY